MPTMTAPDRNEAAEYYFTYIDQVPAGDIGALLEAQLPETLALLRGLSEAQSLERYASDKWSIREVLSHINDAERMFAFRAFWFARGYDTPLPSFDQNIAIANAQADQRSWASHLAEFETVRRSTLSFVASIPDEAWMRRGTASGYEFTVRALVYTVAGHLAHHVRILRERYLSAT